MFEFPVLIADIGGTYARFAILPAPDENLSRLINVPTSRYGGPSAAIGSALDALETAPPRSALLGVAGRVDAPVVTLTNAPWTVDAAGIAADLGLSRVVLVNDYVPVAATLPFLDAGRRDELARLGPAVACGGGNRVALGPGTGLGVAACIPVQDRFWLQATEAGHTAFGASDGDEFTTFPLIERLSGRLTAETILSGPGLVRLYRALAQHRGLSPPSCNPAEVIAAAASGDDAAATEALELFLSLLGRFAGDLALIFNATGGVYFGSGILPRIVDRIDRSGLRQAFERKAPFEAVMARIPTFVLTRPEPAIAGLTSIARDPARFIFESHGWP